MCAPRPKMIQNGPKTDANVCVDYAIQADTQICRARSARYVLEQSLVLAHTEFRYVMLLHTLPRSDYVHSMTFAASSLGLFGLTFLLKNVIGATNLKHTLHAKHQCMSVDHLSCHLGTWTVTWEPGKNKRICETIAIATQCPVLLPLLTPGATHPDSNPFTSLGPPPHPTTSKPTAPDKPKRKLPTSPKPPWSRHGGGLGACALRYPGSL